MLGHRVAQCDVSGDQRRALAVEHVVLEPRESWLDTLAFIWKWIIEPRTGVAVFTAALVLGWLGNLAGISPDWTAVVRDPAAIYYGAQGALNRAYDGAIRTYYRSPLVTQIQTRIEQLREIS